MGSRLLGVVIVSFALCAAWPFSLATVKATETAVKIDNFTFNPRVVAVKTGTTVTWQNGDDIPHTVTATKKQFNSKVLDTEQKFSFTFTTPGVYEYFCALHPHMTGRIVVEAASGSASPASNGSDPSP